MTFGENVILVLMVYIAIRELFYIISTQKMLNKIMSKNYHDYQFSSNVDKTMKTEQENLHEKMKDEQDLEEDLAPIVAFGNN